MSSSDSISPTTGEPAPVAAPEKVRTRTTTSTSNLSGQGPKKRFVAQQIPASILENQALNEAIKALPSNYSFEIHKSLWRISVLGAKRVALQFPEGLLMYACTIADILEKFGNVTTLIMGDVTYGACCIDDFTARALGCDLLIHYGHSCLVPVDVSQIATLYVFVDISFQTAHLTSMLAAHFDRNARLVLAATIQFSAAIQAARKSLQGVFSNIVIPQCRPLSQGEVLGCTAPILDKVIEDELNKSKQSPPRNDDGGCKGTETGKDYCGSSSPGDSNSASWPVIPLSGGTEGSVVLNRKQASGSTATCCGSNGASESSNCCDESKRTCSSSSSLSCNGGSQNTGASVEPTSMPGGDVCVFVADGRFHLEAFMIQNPHIKFYKYNPYNKMLTMESFDHGEMNTVRRKAIDEATRAKRWGVILGTLGRQGSTDTLTRVEGLLRERQLEFITVLLSEIFPAKLALMSTVDAWVQIACPRLSIDWGDAFPRPLLSTYEFEVALGTAPWLPKGVYPMDYYSHDGGTWANYNPVHMTKRRAAQGRVGTRTAVRKAVGGSGSTVSPALEKPSGESQSVNNQGNTAVGENNQVTSNDMIRDEVTDIINTINNT